MTMKTRRHKTSGRQQKHSKREVDSNTILPQETRNISNKQPNLTPKAIKDIRSKKNPV